MTKDKNSEKKIEELQEKIGELEAEVQKNLAGWQRAQADYANFKKETEERRKGVIEFANATFMAEVLPVYNHFKLALSHIPEDQKDQDWIVGIYQIQKQFQDFLKKYNIEEIKTVGEKFDPSLHEAIAHEEKDGFDSDTIFEEVQPGYMLGDNLLGPAKVKVAK